jgi:TupA-like ATPgrasp
LATNPRLRIEYAEAAMSRMDWVEAITRWQAILDTCANHAPSRVYARLTQAHRRRGTFEAAGAILDEGLTRHPSAVELTRQKALQHAELGRTTLGSHAFEQILSAIQYFRLVGLRRPLTFNEKVIFQKLFNRDPRMPPLVDKVAVKPLVAAKLGQEWITPTLFAGRSLPTIEKRNWQRPYVIKPNHRSGAVLFVRPGDQLNWPATEQKCDSWVSNIYGQHKHEWAYREITPMILVEECLGGDTSPADYKFFVFGGRVEIIQVDTGRFSTHRRSMYNRQWEKLPFSLKYPADPTNIAEPANLRCMIEAAEELGNDWDFVRVDLYEIETGPRFGEMTFYPDSGRGQFDPPKYDSVLGQMWR